MRVLVLGGAGMLGPYVVPLLEHDHELLVTDIKPLAIDFRGSFRYVDVANFDQVMDAATGMDAIINLSVLRQDRQLAFDVNTLGCYNMMSAAVNHGIRRVINTGPHFTVAGPSYEHFDFELNPDMPPQPGIGLYAITKALGQEICRVFAEEYEIYVQTYLFYNFRDPDDLHRDRPVRPFAISWQNAATIFPLGLKIALQDLPSRCEVFNIFTDMPHGQFRNEKAKRILDFEPWDDISSLWRKV